jgi:hypothetical protein
MDPLGIALAGLHRLLIMTSPDGSTKMSEQLSIYLLVLMRVVFLTLLLYLVFSIAAGLLMPGEVVGRYALVVNEPGDCADLEQPLNAANVNNVRFDISPADIAQLPEGMAGSSCWLEIRGVPDSGVGDAAQPLYDAALGLANGPLTVKRDYQPRFGEAETLVIWLLSIGLACAWVFASRGR